MRLQEIVSNFRGAKKTGNKFMAYCPVHESDGKHNPSLSISEGNDGKILMKCFAGCETIHILASVGLSFSDLFIDQKKTFTEDSFIAKYSYVDESGALLYWIDKTITASGEKKFRPRRFDKDGKTILYTLEDVKRVLYNLPDVLKAVKEEQTIYICEGEKDCDAMKTIGLTATTNTFGAQANWEKYYTDWLKGSEIVIIEDKDEAGKKHTKKIRACLGEKVKSIKVVKLPDIGEHKVKDAFDWINYGGTVEELKKIVSASASKQNLTEKPDIDVIVSQLNVDDFVFIPNRGIYKYNSGYYEEYDNNYLEHSIKKLLPEPSKRLISEVVKMFELSCLIPQGKSLNQERNYLNLRNGLLNVQTGMLEDHYKEIHSTIQLPIKYDENSQCPRWEQFLKETLEDQALINIVQEFTGLCLIPETRFEKCLLLYGEGSNGKSTFIKILQHIFGRQNYSTISMTKLDSDFHRAGLVDKLVNICGELEIKEVESSAYFKSIVSGDNIDAAYKFKDVFSFRPFCRLIFACNELPRVKDRSHGFFRRLLIIPFNKTFSGENADKHLEQKLIDESNGIFIWALQGLKRLFDQECFTHSDICVKEILHFEKSCNPVLEFLEHHCTISATSEIDKKDFYDHYKNFCTDQSLHFLNAVNFFKEIRKKVINLIEEQPRFGVGKRIRMLKGITYNEN